MRFSLAGPQVFAVTRPVRGGGCMGMGEDDYNAWDTPSEDYSMFDTPQTDAEYASMMPPTYDYEADGAAPTEKPTDWLGIFNTSARALATITPAVTGVMAMQYQNKAQNAANDLALAQAQLAAQRRVVTAPAAGALPAWVVPAALGGVVLLAAGFFLTKMPRSTLATNPRKRR